VEAKKAFFLRRPFFCGYLSRSRRKEVQLQLLRMMFSATNAIIVILLLVIFILVVSPLLSTTAEVGELSSKTSSSALSLSSSEACCAVMCTTPPTSCCLACSDTSSDREHYLLMTAMEGITHHIMDKHYATNNDKQNMPWLASRAWEGNSHIGNRPAQATYYYDWIRSLVINNGEAVERICEIGMNGGHSAIIFLAATTRFTNKNKNNQDDDGVVSNSSSGIISNKSAKLIMFDLDQYEYSTTAKKYIETMFPGRFTYYPGNSLITLPQWTSNLTKTTATSPNEEEKCDVFSIDGDHSYEGALQDIRNAALATKQGGYIILDDMNPGSGTRKALDTAVLVDKIIGQPKCVENVLIKVGYNDRTDVTNARSLLISWCSAVVL